MTLHVAALALTAQHLFGNVCAADPQFFDDGMKLVWRNGDSQAIIDGVPFKCLAPPGCGPGKCPPVGSPTDTKVWSYTWYYTW